MKAKDLTELGQWVGAQHGWPAAKAFKAWQADDAARAVLTRKALELLAAMPASVDRAALTCAYAVHLLTDWDAPVQVIAGRLRIEGRQAFADRLPGVDLLQGPKVRAAEPDHLWIMIGSLVVDVALFREAYAAGGAAGLAQFVHLQFGPGKALYAEDWRQARRRGLSYEPAHVLGAQQVTAMMAGAYRALEGQ
jgi:hypothetical protein